MSVGDSSDNPLTLRRKLLIAAIIIFPFASWGGYALSSLVWAAQAEAAIRETIAAELTGQSPKGIDANVGKTVLPTDLALPYEIIGPENFTGRASIMEFFSPRLYAGTLHFANGHDYEVEAWRADYPVWQVNIWPRR